MCGITGKISGSEPVEQALLERMCQVIEHRGPNSRGVHCDGGVGLGIQRLAIIDLETGDQPIYNEDESVVLVLNGEIYNYKELRADLVARGHTFRTHTDTEVIVHLYEDHGDRCVEHLRGMFAFALWDRRERRLLMARDRVGKKPLFYAEIGDTIWFGSEAKSILQDPAVPRDVNYDAIDAFLSFEYCPAPLSAFAALRKLPPAHTLTWTPGQPAKTQRYWKLSYGQDRPYSDERELHEAIREELMESTRLRLRSDVPLGAFLSGGVDSSAVVAAMAKQMAEPVKTFSIGFDVESFDETQYAREISQLYGTEHHEFHVDPDALEILPRLVWHYGEPFADQSAIPSFHLAELTRGHVTVALNGDGGDESFAGYRRYVANNIADKLEWVPRPLSRTAARVLDRVGEGPRENSMRGRFGRLFNAMTMEPYERYAMWIAYFTERDRETLYTPEFRDQLASMGHERAALKEIRDPYLASDAHTEVERLLDVDVNGYLPGALLVKMDIATMAHSLEVRSPLLDHKMMELAASIPGSLKLQGRTTKKVLKDALEPWLPHHILHRPKMGFGVPIGEWFRGRLRDLPGEVLLDPRALERGLFREERLRSIIDDHQAGRADNANRIWALLQLELWMRAYIDASDPAPPPAVPVA